MPNHIQNRLRIEGDKESVAKLFEQIKGTDGEGKPVKIDFNKIKKMPPSLEIISDSWLSPIENRFSFHTPIKEHLDSLRKHLNDNPERASETVENFISGIRNYIKHGHTTWYGWSVENWGTKWNAYGLDDKRDTDNTIHFQTAWSSPVELIAELSRQNPNVRISLDYADEDGGSNTGKLIFSNGIKLLEEEPESQSKEGYELFFELHPDRINDYELVNGNYQYKEE